MQNDILQRAKGVRDFGPEEKIAREKIVETLKGVFESFGYNPIETPILERYELFSSKFGVGEESDAMRETFKLKDQGARDLVLRTEFTVPFSRFVGMNPQLKKPFKRYQMGQVFRDGPIKIGRYREFWQCDVDVVGIDNPKIDSEIIQLAIEAFQKLGLKIILKINNRKILNGILDHAGVEAEKQISAIIAIDKLDKIGAEGVKTELLEKGVDAAVIDAILSLIAISGTNQEKLEKLKKIIGENAGLNEVAKAIDYALDKDNIIFSPALARGLAYYTGNVFEVYLSDQSEISSSICAGGRFDNMIGGLLGGKEVYPAVGISFGLETIFDAIKLTPNSQDLPKSVVMAYFVPLDEKYMKTAMAACKELRQNGIRVDIDYLARKLKKNLEYVNSYNIPWVIMLGDEEVKNEQFTLRDMKTGEQKMLGLKEIIEKIKK